MKRLWDKARANRPSVYQRNPELTLKKKYFGKGLNRNVEQFSKFFLEFVEFTTPKHPMDVQELYRLLSACQTELRFREVLPRRWNAYNLMGHMLLLRDALVHLTGDEREASAVTVKLLLNLCVDFRSTQSFDRYNLGKIEMQIYHHLFSRRYMFAQDPPIRDRSLSKEVSDLLNERMQLAQTHPSWDVETEVPIRKSILEKLLIFVEDSSHLGGPIIRYPEVFCRLFAIIGKSRRSSYIAKENGYERLSEINVGELRGRDEIRLTPDHMAAIAIYPWEADHLEKARVMLERGIPVCNPLGKLFIGEREFGLFQWVVGKTLSSAERSDVWGEYGRIIRLCHENGIMPNDAAGRNAVWNGNAVTLIDFEHTVLNESQAPVSEEDRMVSLSRIRNELSDKGDLLKAFLQGYSGPH